MKLIRFFLFFGLSLVTPFVCYRGFGRGTENR